MKQTGLTGIWIIFPILVIIGCILGLALIFIPKSQTTDETVGAQVLKNPLPSSIPSPKNNIPSLTLDSIFSSDHSLVKTLPEDKIRVLIATGDVIPARVVNIQTNKFNNFKWPYEKTAEVLKSADLTFVNLETPLIKDCPYSNEGFKFCGSDKNIEGLVYAGIDVVSLANNHAGNYGLIAINSTAKQLEENGISVTGQDGPTYKNVRGLKFAFLGYNDIGASQPGISWADANKITTDITEARKNADVVVVTYHWGIEYQDQPGKRQKDLGHFTIDAGADLVIGNHPHWIQPIEFYKGKLITYAHGNFVFDQEWSQKTKLGVVGKYTFYDDQLVDVEYLPLKIENYGQPYFLTGQEKDAIITHMKQQSQILAKSSSP